jgi:hypothetical protein
MAARAGSGKGVAGGFAGRRRRGEGGVGGEARREHPAAGRAGMVKPGMGEVQVGRRTAHAMLIRS